MISDLSSLTSYTIQMAEKLPVLKDEIIIKPPGLNQSDRVRLLGFLPNLPESYLNCVQSVNLKGVFIGYFRLWPRAAKSDGLVESLVRINTPEKNPFWGFEHEMGIYEVAAWEAEPICVATKNSSYKEGSVLKISISQLTPKEVFLAPMFEIFLLVAANLDAIRDKYSQSQDRESASGEFDLCLAHFELPPVAVAAWKNISRVVLDM